MIWLSWILWVGQPVVFEGGFLSQPDGAKPVVLIVDDFKLAYVGESIPKEWANKIQQHLSLDGGYVLPGLIDAHAHLSSLGNALESVDLVGTSSYQEVVARAKIARLNYPKEHGSRAVVGTKMIGRPRNFRIMMPYLKRYRTIPLYSNALMAMHHLPTRLP